MSVRRLADPSVQPAAFAFQGANAEWAARTIQKYPAGRQQSAVIPLLMRAQEQEGWVSKAAIETVAGMLDMPTIRVLEVATFYTQYQLKPVGTRAHVQVCGTTPCMLRGSEALMDVCRSRIHHDQFHTNAAGTLSWEEVECLGACVNAPMVMIFKDTYEDLTPERLAEIIDRFEAGEGGEVQVGPQVDRVLSAPQSGLTSLTDERAVLKSTRDQAAREEAEQAEGSGAGAAAAPQQGSTAADPGGAVKGPPDVRLMPGGERGVSSDAAPPHNGRAANKSEPAVEAGDKDRNPPRGTAGADAPHKAAELHRGEPIGADAKDEAAPEAGRPGVASAGTDASGEAPNPENTAAPSGAPTADPPQPAGPAPSLSDPNRPAGIERPAQPDNLQQISGVGPKIEATLHGLGIYTFAQIAGWTPAEQDWADRYLKFRGRIARDRWVEQAAALARGGAAEYQRVFGKKPV